MRIRKVLPKKLLLLCPFLLLLAACGTSTSTTSASATATACAQATRPASALKTATGTLNSINGQTLTMASQRGGTVTVTYTSSTTFSQESLIPATSLQEGTNVRVTVTSSGSTYTATNIVVVSGTNSGLPQGTGNGGNFGNGRGSNPCAAAARGRFGRGGSGNGTGGTSGTNSFRGLTGTVGQLNGTSLTITDTKGANYTVTITPQTQIMQTQKTTAAALKVGQPLTIIGKAGSQGAISATSVTILLSLPAPRATPTPAQ